MSDSAAPLTADTGSATGSASVETSAPQTTEQVTANVVEQMEAADAAPASTRIDTTDVTVSHQENTQPTAAEISAAAKFLEKQGHKFTKADGRDTWLPVKTVERMLERYVDEHKNTWTGERSTLEGQTKELREHIAQLRAGVAGDPKAFLAELAGIDPRYAAFLAEQPQRRETPAAADDPEPQPDYDLGNGSKTYTLKGLQDRDAWRDRQLLRQLEGKLEERFKPLQEREKAAQLREEQDRVFDEVQSRSRAQMQDAQSWPMFGKLAEDGSLSEFQEAVLNELKKDTEQAKAKGERPRLTLEGAYIRVSTPRFAEDDTKRRERLLKEIQGAPKSTSIGQSAAESTRPRGPRTTEEIARGEVERLEKGA